MEDFSTSELYHLHLKLFLIYQIEGTSQHLDGHVMFECFFQFLNPILVSLSLQVKLFFLNLFILYRLTRLLSSLHRIEDKELAEYVLLM